MDAATRTWISSTLATEFVSLSAALAVLDVYEKEDVPAQLANYGGRLYLGLQEIAAVAPTVVEGVFGVPEFCYLKFRSDEIGATFAAQCASHGLLVKRSAYNFVCLAHDELIIRESLACMSSVVEQIGWG
jgi:acetylornithine/succinyldiaminopimelate/putrescine aminotransferase